MDRLRFVSIIPPGLETIQTKKNGQDSHKGKLKRYVKDGSRPDQRYDQGGKGEAAEDLLFLVQQQCSEKDSHHNDRSQGRNTAACKSGVQQHDRQRKERGQFGDRPHQQHILAPRQEPPPGSIRQRCNQADVEPGNGKDVSNAHPRETAAQLRIESAFITDNQRAENGCRRSGQVRVKECAYCPTNVFKPMTQPNTGPVVRLDLFDFSVIPHKSNEIETPPGQIARIIKTTRRMKIARGAEVKREPQHVAVLPATLEMTNGDEHLARCRP